MSAPRPHRNALRLRPLDELGDDQEIAGKTHAGDDVDLEREPLLIGAALMLGNAGRIEAAGKPRPRLFRKHTRPRPEVAGQSGEDRLALRRGTRAPAGKSSEWG